MPRRERGEGESEGGREEGETEERESLFIEGLYYSPANRTGSPQGFGERGREREREGDRQRERREREGVVLSGCNSDRLQSPEACSFM